MAKLTQWLGWIVFCGVIPSVGCLFLALHMHQHETNFYITSAPLIISYFYILGRLGLNIPGLVREANSDDVAYNVLGFDIMAKQPSAKVIGWLRVIVVLLVMPTLGAGLIFYGVRDGEIMGYFLGPAMLWVSGGCWALIVRYLRERTRTA